MKLTKTILTFAAVTSLVLTGFSQKNKSTTSSTPSDGDNCFEEGTKVLNLGVGFLGNNYYNYNSGGAYTYHSSPAFSISYEQGLRKRLGPGVLGLGVYLGFQNSYFRYDDYYYNGSRYYYRHNWTYMMIAARGAYHLDILNTSNGELYFGAVIGVRTVSYRYETNSPDPNRNYYQISQSSIAPAYSLFLGGRYYFTNRIGVFGELGYGISYLTVGLSLKF